MELKTGKEREYREQGHVYTFTTAYKQVSNLSPVSMFENGGQSQGRLVKQAVEEKVPNKNEEILAPPELHVVDPKLETRQACLLDWSLGQKRG